MRAQKSVVVWRQVVDELANALQAAIGLANDVRLRTQATADDAVLLEVSITRSVAALKRVQPVTRKRGRR